MRQKMLLLCFFLSGFAGLVYQVAWVRILSLVFGNTVYAVSIVVASFLVGLALGSHQWGRRIDLSGNPLKTYITLEFLIAFSAVAVTALIYLTDGWMAGLMTVESLTSGGWIFARFALVSLYLVVPTVLMGATTPVMGKVFVNSFDALGRGIGSLYAANTYGAMAGAFIAGFLLVPLLGVKGSIAVAVCFNVAVALLLLRYGKKLPEAAGTGPEENKASRKKARQPKVQVAPDAAAARETAHSGFALTLIVLSGFCALAFEILWTRAFVVQFKSTVYLFSNLLTVFLFGMAMGSHFISKRLDYLKHPLELFGMAQLSIGVLGMLSVVFFNYASGIAGALGTAEGGAGWAADVVATFVLMLTVFFVPTFLMGLGYPLICRAAAKSIESLGRDVGLIYATGTAGGIAGSLVAGFVLLPTVGLQNAIFLVSVVALATGGLAFRKRVPQYRSARIVPLSALIALVVFAGIKFSGIDIGLGRKAEGETVFAKEGVMGTVRVMRNPEQDRLTLMVNSYSLASSGDVAARFGHIPMLLKPDARDVLVISLGSGITSGSVGGHPVERIECVEIVPTLMEVQPFFEKDNHNITADQRFKLTFWDGRHYVRVTRAKYDLVISDLFQPDSAGVGNLYSREHFQNVRATLKEGGAMALWLPTYQLSPQDLKVVMRTFASVFDHVGVWYGDYISDLSSVMLIGSQSPLHIDPEMLAGALQRKEVQRDMVEHSDMLSFLSLYITDRDGIMRFTEGSPLNTDDFPVIEYTAPRSIGARHRNALANFEAFIGLREKVAPLLTGATAESFGGSLDRYFDGRTRILNGKVHFAKEDYQRQWDSFREAARYTPHDPALAFNALDLGYLFYHNRNYKAALTILEWSRKVDPGQPQTHELLAKVYRETGRNEDAAAAQREFEQITSRYAR
ncbi:MAG: hypothetical protein A3F73_14280 [Gallionellales bacterium RIFCSPLOWO2_12_FULL_59_22]|nr:MAG: hypothetical protein A3H99_01600 [Gallionellales bacterium RIFCSPLOWO2_02_FULL_59_110]OGT03766.1 MAG: hypothetical protein A2Z65_07085 [Gallionellales bacterium RIFCSPLOWO2_02_58_13]OGT14722.1 MAG: hypothetical protein A3F73_14280 [Gallionellales bacterium RIFCSPLOWO2_12_FULL_59_22]